LSGLASQVTDAIFGPNPQDSGTVQFGEQTITFVRGLESIVLTIFDDRTGESTQIQVPTLTP
jgi:curli production assembly/transport component CsgF